MAEGFLRSFDPTLVVHSAGTRPAAEVHPLAVVVIREMGIDLSGQRPQHVDRFLGESFDYVITVCSDAKEQCPFFTGTVRHRLHIGFEDPAAATGSEDEILGAFRIIRDQIRDAFQQFHRELSGGDTA